MNFILKPPPLQHMALIKIATTLWSQREIKYLSLKSFSLVKHIWQEVEEMIIQKASRLYLPVILKEKLFDIIGPVGLQILSWREIHEQEMQCVTKFPDILFWTPHGTIDSKRVAEVLVKDETLSIEERYQFACVYCLIVDVIHLQKELRRRRKKIDPILTSWSSYLQDKHYLTRRRTHHNLCLNVAASGFDVATRYFFLKEGPQHTKKLAIKAFKRLLKVKELCHDKRISGKESDVLFFLLSRMTEEEQAEIYRAHTYEILRSSLLWPRQSLFLEIAKEKWGFLSKVHYYFDLLNDIVENMGCRHNYLSEVFTEFWRQAPETYNQFVNNAEDIELLLLRLYEKKDEKNVQLILKDCSISARKKLIFHGTAKILSDPGFFYELECS